VDLEHPMHTSTW